MSMAYGAGVGALRSWAAMSWWQQGAASTSWASHSTARASASSVAVSQACRASTTSGARSSRAPEIEPTTNSASTPRSAATALLCSRDCSLTSTPVTTTGSSRTEVRKRCAAKVR